MYYERDVFVELLLLTLCLISLSFLHPGGADVGGGGDGAVSKATRTLYAGDKRHSTGNSTDGPTAKKSSLDISTVKRPQPTKKVGIAFNLGASKLETTKTPAPPVKLKLGERVIICRIT